MRRFYTNSRTNTQVVLVDEDIYIKYLQYSIGLSGNGYPMININNTRIYLHRLIMNFPKDDVDHINHNLLDCRKINLRICKTANNMQNMNRHKDNRCKFKGVSLRSDTGKYQVRIMVKGKRIQGGCFNTEIMAARYYDYLAKIYHKEFAKLNFLEQQQQLEQKSKH